MVLEVEDMSMMDDFYDEPPLIEAFYPDGFVTLPSPYQEFSDALCVEGLQKIAARMEDGLRAKLQLSCTISSVLGSA